MRYLKVGPVNLMGSQYSAVSVTKKQWRGVASDGQVMLCSLDYDFSPSTIGSVTLSDVEMMWEIVNVIQSLCSEKLRNWIENAIALRNKAGYMVRHQLVDIASMFLDTGSTDPALNIASSKLSFTSSRAAHSSRHSRTYNFIESIADDL